MSLPQVVHEDVNQITSELIRDYELMTSKTLYPAQIERLLIDLIAYRELLLRAAINDAARQNLVDFARLPMLIRLGARVETFLLAAQAARALLRFSLADAAPTDRVIALGHRVQSNNGVIFATTAEAVIRAGELFTDVRASAIEPGQTGNGLLPGFINQPFDPMPDGVTVTNITISNGGAEVEGTERFRQRVKLAQSRPGAGSDKQYIYLALTADSRVIDVRVIIVAPGHVRIICLCAGDPTEIIAAVHRFVHAPGKRPTTDNVEVIAGERVPVPLTITITPRRNSLVSTLEATANAVMAGYAQMAARTLGYDVVDSEVATLVQSQGGMKRVVVTGVVPIHPENAADVSWTLVFTEPEDD